jgi:hypothetical protein
MANIRFGKTLAEVDLSLFAGQLMGSDPALGSQFNTRCIILSVSYIAEKVAAPDRTR